MGNAKDVKIKIGSWEGKVNSIVAIIDDFDFVLGLNFMMKAQAIPFPTTSCLIVFGERPCVILATILPKSEKRMISTIQFKNGVKKGKPSYMAMPIYEGKINRNPIPEKVKLILEEFQDIMLEQLPRVLLPWRVVNHKIELLSGVKLPIKRPYKMAPLELAKLRKQLDKLIQARFIIPSKAPYKALVLF